MNQQCRLRLGNIVHRSGTLRLSLKISELLRTKYVACLQKIRQLDPWTSPEIVYVHKIKLY
jgi:hypothetical protein